ncbi:hypothetical protein FA15DRAFT_409064 [Coprinopsis marcescibilis]|uniref:DUF6533 domain-containing protein n=1 Tax=Coprinopsis marcescibilis TaxID=230819 RepID=A0A5C3L8S5_COPMA|nr:hypothetical protein FA15DRAFT_409064 [Coprinopsis marcescibilis]
MSDEVQLIWPNPWNFTKIAFFFIRYFPPMLEMSTQFYGVPLLTYTAKGCYIWNVYQGLSSILVVAAVDYILILRVFAMYPRNRTIKFISAFLYVAELVTMAVGIGLAVPLLKFDDKCVVYESPIIFIVAAGCPIAFQAFLFGVTLWKFLRAFRSGWGNVPFVQLLARDGTWAFMVLFAMLISEAALYGFAADAYTGFLYGWLNTAFSICGYRVLININALNKKSRTANQGQSLTRTGADIQFTSNINTTLEASQTSNAYRMTTFSISVENDPASDRPREIDRTGVCAATSSILVPASDI